MMDVARLPVQGEGALIEALASVVDPRHRRGVRHPVGYVVSLSLCAILTGCTSFIAIADWASHQPVEVRWKLGAKREKAPSEPTIRRVLSSIQASGLEALITTWLRGLVALFGEALALDGKSLRGAGSSDGALPHLVSALVHGLGVVIAEYRVAGKSNEITSVQPLLESVDIAGAVVTGDAMFAQKKIAQYLVDTKHADYLFTVKDNQPTLKADIEALHLERTPPSGEDVREGTWAHRDS